MIRHTGRIMREAGPFRMAVTGALLLLALVVARFSWDMPLVVTAERGLYDLRATAFAPRVEQDRRIVMVVFNDQTLIATRKRSPLDRATLSRALASMDGMGVKSIGIDILFDQPQDEDDQLRATLARMKTPVWLAYAAAASNADQIIYDQQQFLDAFMASVRSPKVRPASIRLNVDADNVARSWPDRVAKLPDLMTRAMAPAQGYEAYRGSIAYRLPRSSERPVFASFPIDLFTDPAVGAAFADQVRERHVLIGGDIVDIDQFETPMTPATGRTMVGLEVHAHMLAQMLDGPPWHRVSDGVLWALALLVVVAAALTSLTELRWWQLLPVLLGQGALFGGLPFILAYRGLDTQGIPAIGWAVGWVIAFVAIGTAARAVGAEQRRFAQSALGKYLPRDIAAQILSEPEKLALHGEKRDIFVLFTDLEGFTKLSHKLAPEIVASLLNRYLDTLSDVVLAHGGTIDKFVGDAVVAFWGAPISRPDDGRNAARAAYAMWRAGEEFRTHLPDGVGAIGKTRVGLHWGAAIVGNFGGEGRIQYTALGDSMNTAARLESANKELCSSVMASREAMERSGLDWWRPMGRVVLRGRETPVELFEPAPDFPARDARHLTDLLALLSTDRQAALDGLAQLVAAHPGDAALQNLYVRCERTETGDAYVLG